jgi:hypothetical protein
MSNNNDIESIREDEHTDTVGCDFAGTDGIENHMHMNSAAYTTVSSTCSLLEQDAEVREDPTAVSLEELRGPVVLQQTHPMLGLWKGSFTVRNVVNGAK